MSDRLAETISDNSFDPEINLDPGVNLDPEINMDPEVNMDPVINMDPEININPEINLDPDVNLNPDVNLDPEINMDPDVNLDPETVSKPLVDANEYVFTDGFHCPICGSNFKYFLWKKFFFFILTFHTLITNITFLIKMIYSFIQFTDCLWKKNMHGN